jgi:hypothetical protein
MSRSLRTFLAALVAIATMALLGAGDKERQPFLNFARIDISVQGEQQAADLFGLVRTFASERGYSIQGAPFPKRGRIVTNIKILIKREPETFWTLDNFRDTNTFELCAYSHDEESVWRASWNELVSKISTSLGEANVVKKK